MRDLEFFGLEPDTVDHSARAAERTLQADGLSIERVLDNPVAVWLLVASDNERTGIDLGSARLSSTISGTGGWPNSSGSGARKPASLFGIRGKSVNQIAIVVTTAGSGSEPPIAVRAIGICGDDGAPLERC